MATSNNNKALNVPHLRFPEFTGEWKKCKFGDIATGFDYGMNAAAKPFDGENKYIRITDIDEVSSTYDDKDIVSPDGILTDNYAVNDRDILLARTGASTGKSYLYRKSDGKLYYAGFLIRANITEHNPYFVFSQLHTHRYWRWVSIMSARSGQPGINSQEYSSFPIFTTSLHEENKIASLLSRLDERIATQNKIIEDLEKLKSAIRERLYMQIQKGGFEHKTIRDVLSYEHPTKYIVVDTEYTDDKELTPVLTANKTFILGYTPEQENIYRKGDCIIFDDFTMNIKFVSSPFKIKSSAIKILTARSNVNLYFIYEYLLFLNLISEEHKRHYISEIEPLHIVVPGLVIQHKIADILQCIDKQIYNAQQLQFAYQRQKQYLLNQMFI